MIRIQFRWPSSKPVSNFLPTLVLIFAWSVVQLLADPLDHWTLLNPLPTPDTIYDVAFQSGLFVAVGGAGTILTSTDAVHWTRQESDAIGDLHSVTFGNVAWVAVGASTILTSLDGVRWTLVLEPSQVLLGVAFTKDIFVAVGRKGAIWTSSDGLKWTPQNSGSTSDLESVAFGNGTFVAVGGVPTTETVLASSDAITWTTVNQGDNTYYYSVAFGNGRFVAVGFQGMIISSPDGRTWQVARPAGERENLHGVSFVNDRFLAVGDRGAYLTSADGTTWPTNATTIGDGNLHSVGYGANTFLATGDAQILTSADSTTWTNRVAWADQWSLPSFNLPPALWGTAVTNYYVYGNGRYVAVTFGYPYELYISQDAKIWTPILDLNPGPPTLIPTDIAYGNGFFAVTAYHYADQISVCLSSPDGITWTTNTIPTDQVIYWALFSQDRFLALGNLGNADPFYTNGYYVFQSDPITPPYSVSVSPSTSLLSAPTDTGSFLIQRGGNTAIGIDLNVNLSFSGTASNGVDYVFLPNSVVIPAGQTTVSVRVVPKAAPNVTWTKTLTVQVEAGEAYSIGSANFATILIENPGPAPHFRTSATTRTPDGAAHLVIDSPAGASFQIQASSDLVNWAPLTTVTNSTGTAQLDDPSAAAQARRYYRTKSF